MRGLTVGVALFALFIGVAVASPTVSDPPRIVPWHQIGNIGLGMSHERVERMYGAPINGNPPHNTIIWEYRGRGVIDVIYDQFGHVQSLSTSSPDYATRSGIRVGMHLPRGSCHTLGVCRDRWRGFTLRDIGTTAKSPTQDEFQWERTATYGHGPVRVTVTLDMRNTNTVQTIWLYEYILCPRGEYGAGTVCKPSPQPPQPAPPAGTRYCTRPGFPGNFLAASPDVTCSTAKTVESRVFSRSCVSKTRCEAEGFVCLAYWDGRYDRPFEYTHHAICRNGERRIEMDTG